MRVGINQHVQPAMRIRRGMFALLVVAWTVAPAQAQWVVTPYLGINLAGDAEFRRGGPGTSVGYFGGRLGLEFDLERSWHFFKDSDLGNTGSARADDVNTRALSVMGNLVAPIQIKGMTTWRPYASAGLGMIRASFDRTAPNQSDTHQNDFAFNVGGGVMYRLNDRIGLRGDLRYFRALADEDKVLPSGQRGDLSGYYRDYCFLRATFGVTFRFR